MDVKALVASFALQLALIGAVIGVTMWARDVGGRDAGTAAMWTGMGLVTFVGGLVSSRYILGLLRKREEHLARSVAARGFVTAIETSGAEGTEGYSERPVVRYRDHAGREREETVVLPVEGHTVGDTIDVRFDPDEPEWVAVDGIDYAKGDRFLKLAFAVLVVGSLGFLGYGLSLVAAL